MSEWIPRCEHNDSFEVGTRLGVQRSWWMLLVRRVSHGEETLLMVGTIEYLSALWSFLELN